MARGRRWWFCTTRTIKSGSPVTFGASGVTPMEDVVSDDIERMSKAQTQASNIAFQIQSDFDDARSKELFTMFSGKRGKEIIIYR